MALSAHVVDDPAALGPYVERWDELAVSCGRPYCAPAWMLGWWRNAAPERSRLVVVAAVEDGSLIGIAPFFAVGRPGFTRYRLLSAPICSPTEPLAAAGRESDCARVFARALADQRPRPTLVEFDGIGADSRWPPLLREVWPGHRRPSERCDYSLPAPGVPLDGIDLDSYLASRSRNFRNQLTSKRRRFESDGARYGMPEAPEDVDGALDAFARLHYARWRDAGGSAALDEGVEKMLRDAARELVAAGRMRIYTIHVGDQVASVQLFLAAGGVTNYWLGAYDPRWSDFGPGNQGVFQAITDALARSERLIDLGPGGQPYKFRFADAEQQLDWLALAPGRPGSAVLRARRTRRLVREMAARRLPDRARRAVIWLRRRRARA